VAVNVRSVSINKMIPKGLLLEHISRNAPYVATTALHISSDA
jgi:hypothetical protein